MNKYLFSILSLFMFLAPPLIAFAQETSPGKRNPSKFIQRRMSKNSFRKVSSQPSNLPAYMIWQVFPVSFNSKKDCSVLLDEFVSAIPSEIPTKLANTFSGLVCEGKNSGPVTSVRFIYYMESAGEEFDQKLKEKINDLAKISKFNSLFKINTVREVIMNYSLTWYYLNDGTRSDLSPAPQNPTEGNTDGLVLESSRMDDRLRIYPTLFSGAIDDFSRWIGAPFESAKVDDFLLLLKEYINDSETYSIYESELLKQLQLVQAEGRPSIVLEDGRIYSSNNFFPMFFRDCRFKKCF